MERNTKRKNLGSLKNILKDSNVFLKGVTWENVHILGDANINCLVKEIKGTDKWFMKNVKGNETCTKLTKKLADLFRNSLEPFVEEFEDYRKDIVKKLEASKTGVNKPILPMLRDYETFFDKHVIATAFKDPYAKPLWRSMVALRSGNHSGNERYHLMVFESMVHSPEGLKQVSACGHYWQVEITSSTIMSYDDFRFFRRTKDKEFVELWFSNSSDRDLGKFSEFEALLKLPVRKFSGVYLKSAIRKLMQYFRDPKNFPEEKFDEMKNCADALEMELKRPKK